MREETQKNNETQAALTTREQEIFTMLLDGVAPKELAHSLNITLNTFKTHQKNLYRKLNVSNIRELITKFRQDIAVVPPPPPTAEDKPAVFYRWFPHKDELGSSIKITEKIEQIEGEFFTTITIAGKLAPTDHSFAGAHALPDPSTLEKMKRFSLKVLGDGNSYAVMIPTIDTRLKSDYNHYRKLFTTQNGKISTITVNIEELVQSPFWGTPVPFKKSKIEFIQFHAHVTSKFNLKIWDFRFYP
jgi:DNA-binding CsgD family transcriptional regulator